jgi:hypothetical protein
MRGEGERGLPEGCHRRSPRGSGINGEVAAAVPGGDEELDDVRESTVSPKRWSTGSGASCNGGERWLELGVAAVVFWTCRRSAKRGDLGAMVLPEGSG